MCLLNKQGQSNKKRFYRRDAKGAEDNIFSFAVERTAKEKQCPSGRIAFIVFRPLSEKQ